MPSHECELHSLYDHNILSTHEEVNHLRCVCNNHKCKMNVKALSIENAIYHQ